jgi:hypothetical protein
VLAAASDLAMVPLGAGLARAQVDAAAAAAAPAVSLRVAIDGFGGKVVAALLAVHLQLLLRRRCYGLRMPLRITVLL